MINNTANEANNKELTSYQKLLIQLDNEDFAREFRAKTLARCKHLIGDILSVTSGWSVVAEENSEYGHGCLLELLETLAIRHKNFYVADFACDLQTYIFSYSTTYEKAERNWKAERLADRGLDKNGIEFETAKLLQQGRNDA